MTHQAVLGAFALGALIFAVGVFMSPMISATAEDAETSVELADNDSEEVMQYLEVEPSVNETNGNATVTVRNTRTFDTSDTAELQTGDEDTVTVSGENVTVQNSAFSDPEVVLDVTYPPTFAYDGGAKTFYGNLDVILATVGLVIVMSTLFLGVFRT